MLRVLREMGQKRERKVMIRSSLLSLYNTLFFTIFLIHNFNYIENSYTSIMFFKLSIHGHPLAYLWCCKQKNSPHLMLLLKPLHTLKAAYIKQLKSHCSVLLMGLYMTETLQQPHGAAPQLCLSSHTAGTAATSHMVHGKRAYTTFLGSFTNYQVLDGLQDQDELCNCYRGQPDPTAENIR